MDQMEQMVHVANHALQTQFEDVSVNQHRLVVSSGQAHPRVRVKPARITVRRLPPRIVQGLLIFFLLHR